MYRVSVDVGGTFTDLVALDEKTREDIANGLVSPEAAKEKYGL